MNLLLLFTIVIATDCHIGYAEKDGVRHSDSLNTFEEIHHPFFLRSSKRQKKPPKIKEIIDAVYLKEVL